MRIVKDAGEVAGGDSVSKPTKLQRTRLESLKERNQDLLESDIVMNVRDP